ncbi:MAG: HlyD family efflux transporter periplasmic adaptor subunit, partial [Rhodobacteraceae bacterium]|nr:HlyD family efflux transporter periplasmic adaptor subunit [Paracoccaceae bacterium]
MRFFARSLLGVFLAAVTAGLLALAALVIINATGARQGGGGGGPSGPTADERIFAANVVTVTPATIAPVMTAYGEVRARRTLQLRNADGGTVIDVAPGVEEGALVTAGALLFRLDPADATSARDLARATLAEAMADEAAATADLGLARDDLAAAERQFALREQSLARQQDLRARDLGSDAATEEAALALSSAEQAVLARRQAVLQAEARVGQAVSTVSRAEITLADAERALRDTAILAPFDGRLTQVNASPGARVGPNELLAEVVDPTALEVMIRLSAGQAAQLPPLDAAPTLFTIAAGPAGPALAGQGILTREGARVAPGESGRVVFGTLQQAEGLLPGDFVTVLLREPPLDAVAMIPATALGADNSVLALGPDDRLESLPVTLLRRQGDDVIIAPVAAAGREIVAERSALLGAG